MYLSPRGNFFLRMSLLVVSLFAFPVKLPAQALPIRWEECLGGSSAEEAFSVHQTVDSGFVVAGYTGSSDGQVTGYHGGSDYWVVKTSATGALQWEQCLGGSNAEVAKSMAQTFDKGYIVAGYSNSTDGQVTGNHGTWDYWVVKLDDTGGLAWENSYGGSASDIATCVSQTSDSGYIVAGASSSNDGDVSGNHGGGDFWVVKLSATGSIQWQNCYGSDSADGATSIQQTIEGGYIVAGASKSIDGEVTGNHGQNDYWILKLSGTGAIEWEQSYGGSGDDVATSIQQTSDSGYIVAGSSNSTDGDVTGNHGNEDIWVVKLSSSGSIQWERSLGGSNDDFGSSVQQTTDSGFVVCGTTFSNDPEVTGNHGMSDMWVVKLSATGTLQWENCYGGSNYDGAGSIQQTFDSNFVVAGYTNSDDSEVTANMGGTDIWLVKLGDTLRTDTTGTDSTKAAVNKINSNATVSYYPNPATTQLTVTSSAIIDNMGVIDMTGQVVYRNTFHSTTAQCNIEDVPPGIYFVVVNGGISGKFRKE
jgi:hypothetical protein